MAKKKKAKKTKSAKKPASKRKDAQVSQRAPKPQESKAKGKKALGPGKDEKLCAAFAALSARDIGAAKELIGKVDLKDKTAQGKVEAAHEALKVGNLMRAHVLLGQAQQILANL